jgi:ferredoxin-type protein NapG
MTDAPNRKRKQGSGISRRDFVLGRVWHQDSATAAEESTAVSGTAPKSSVVMRYPKSLQDVAAADPQSHSESTSEPVPLSATAARRRTIPVLRPPGAIDEPSFLAGCTRCELCIEACPHDAIVHAPEQLREAAGTPMIDADRQPCLMCADFPCIAACEPGVLSDQLPKMMGTARINAHLCLPHHGTNCTVCSEHCPVKNAIVINEVKPAVNETTCTGCGVCRSVCPAPENAILLMPTFLRPALKRKTRQQ